MYAEPRFAHRGLSLHSRSVHDLALSGWIFPFAVLNSIPAFRQLRRAGGKNATHLRKAAGAQITQS